ncbi:MAG: hypothetical protein P9L92_06805 [Candidatus Electryonea clarkiae]|nr:hypothetical protein [Candidatus Electryonea clarkiae]MDP8285238.1 hypothetical protein [Candidatus Electryonea clarkiae]
MKRILFFLMTVLVVTMLPLTVIAGIDDDDDDDYEWKRWKHRHHHQSFLDGFGSFMVGYQTFASSNLEDLASDLQIGELDEGMYTFGGRGMGHVGRGWYIGGGGFGGGARTSGVVGNLNREILLNLGGGGFMFEWAPINLGPLNFGAGSMLGGGGVSIKIIQHTGNLDWDLLSNSFGAVDVKNNIIELDIGFFWARPYVTARIKLLEWMALEGSAGMNLTTLGEGDWTFHEKQLNGDGPNLDIDETFYRFGILFGG